MILPEKHIKFSESIIGLGAILIGLLKKDKTIEDLWLDFEKINNTEFLPAYHSYDNFILCIDLLFIIGAIDVNNNGRLFRCIS